jgi:hypothetical protein
MITREKSPMNLEMSFATLNGFITPLGQKARTALSFVGRNFVNGAMAEDAGAVLGFCGCSRETGSFWTRRGERESGRERIVRVQLWCSCSAMKG